MSKTNFPLEHPGTPIQEPFEVLGILYILPEGKSIHHEVKVIGFPHAPGGILESERLTPGYTKDELTLTTPEDVDLHQELGVSMIRVDHVVYEAINA